MFHRSFLGFCSWFFTLPISFFFFKFLLFVSRHPLMDYKALNFCFHFPDYGSASRFVLTTLWTDFTALTLSRLRLYLTSRHRYNATDLTALLQCLCSYYSGTTGDLGGSWPAPPRASGSIPRSACLTVLHSITIKAQYLQRHIVTRLQHSSSVDSHCYCFIKENLLLSGCNIFNMMCFDCTYLSLCKQISINFIYNQIWILVFKCCSPNTLDWQ